MSSITGTRPESFEEFMSEVRLEIMIDPNYLNVISDEMLEQNESYFREKYEQGASPLNALFFFKYKDVNNE